jgi:folate-binding protein YgfZ
MLALALHEFHARHGAVFTAVNGCEVVARYGDPLAEHAALRQAAGVLDLSSRGRLCVLGADRERFLNGQVTNDVKALRAGQGCYAAIVNAKGRMESDAFIYRLAGEFLLDFEPGISTALTYRLERYVIADDVRIADAAPHYGLLSVQGPQAAAAVAALGLGVELPAEPLTMVSVKDANWGEIHLANQPRVGLPGFDLFVPVAAQAKAAEALIAAAQAVGGRAAGWDALELARIEMGIPRFGADMDATNLPPEAGIEDRAVSYTKGCYIGQEVIARIRTYGQVTRRLRGLRLADDQPRLPTRGNPLFKDGREVGFVTSAVRSPVLNANIALGYVRRECNEVGTELTLRAASGDSPARIVPLPFVETSRDVSGAPA